MDTRKQTDTHTHTHIEECICFKVSSRVGLSRHLLLHTGDSQTSPTHIHTHTPLCPCWYAGSRLHYNREPQVIGPKPFPLINIVQNLNLKLEIQALLFSNVCVKISYLVGCYTSKPQLLCNSLALKCP